MTARSREDQIQIADDNRMSSDTSKTALNDKERLEFALDATATGFWSYDRSTDTFDVDRRMQALLGMTGKALVTKNEWLEALSPTDALVFSAFLNAASRGEASSDDLELRFRRFDMGPDRWLALRAKSMPQQDGAEIVGTARDISDVRLHHEQVHVLMREVTHRSKNLLAIIQAMARQTVKDSLTAADFERRFSARLRGLSFSHEILAAQDWRGASLIDLAHGHLSAMIEQHGERVSITGPAIFIRPEAAQNIGLALNELTSNAMRFGALSGPAGRVAVEWSLEADQSGEPRWLHVLWNEFGGLAIEPPLRQGFGHKVMERVVARALDGIANMTFAPTGLQWSLRIPLHHLMIEDDV